MCISSTFQTTQFVKEMNQLVTQEHKIGLNAISDDAKTTTAEFRLNI